MRTIQSIRFDNFLSFGPGTEKFELSDLNVLIGPNGAGKSNVVEALELLRATPTDFAAAIRDGGGAQEWLWKGQNDTLAATLDTEIELRDWGTLRHQLMFSVLRHRVEIVEERIESSSSTSGEVESCHYRLPSGVLMYEAGDISIPASDDTYSHLRPDQSMLTQFRGAFRTPPLSRFYGNIQTFREWTFGRYTHLRQPQRADLPEDHLLPDASNLSLVLLQIEHTNGRVFNRLLKRFLPRFDRMSTLVSGNTVQFFLHESGLSTPISAARLSDGTLRFIAMLAIFLTPTPPPLVCIEEPELGLHPDALAIVAELLVEASKQMQVVVTTHSDALVSALTNQPDAVVVCEKANLNTTLRRLDPERLRHWLQEYQLGDLWRMGEIGANP